MVGYDWHRDEDISRRGEGEFSPDLVARYWCSHWCSDHTSTSSSSTVVLCCVREAGHIIRSHNGSRPLFLYVAFQAAHGPIMTPPRQYLDMYNTGGVSRHHLNRAATISVG